MKKLIHLLALSFIILTSAFGQNLTEANFSLYKFAHQNELKNNASVEVLIQGDVETIKQLVVSAGGKFEYSAGDISKVTIKLQNIEKITSSKSIERLEITSRNARPLNDTMLKNNNVILVHSGQAPLTQGYDGTGVVVGFIDTGIDFAHGDFRDSLGHSRVKFLWDHNLTGNPPTGYSYGTEFTNTDIDNGLAAASSDVNNCSNYAGHGTHTAGVAVGNGLASNSYKGVAPKADIIMVAMSWCGTDPFSFTDAINYIYTKALAMGKPCVINISLGGLVGGVNQTYGSHDGMDLQAQMINNLMNAHTGRAIVAAAGNDGYNPYHLGYTVAPNDTNFTLFTPPPTFAGNNIINIQLYGSVADMTNLSFSIGADEVTPVYSFRGKIHFSTMFPLGPLRNDTLFNAGHRIGVMQSIASQPYAGTYKMEFVIQPDSLTYDWRLIVTGSGKFDSWNYGMVSLPLPPPSVMHDSIHYKLPDSKQTICTSFQCLDNVVTVGNYTNRRSYLSCGGIPYTDFSKVPGRIDASSSVGPTRDGRTKPDVVSPGDMTIAAIPLGYYRYVASCCTDNLTVDSLHVRDGGTSAASPSVAGIAALYLQKNPNATAAQVRAAIDGCTTIDAFTGTVPNNIYGYGKANAFTTLVGCSGLGVENIVNTNTISIYPNPTTSGSIVTIDISNFKAKDKMELTIYNALGEQVKSITVASSSVQLNNSLPSGVYFCNLMVNGRMVTTKKLVIL